MNSSNFVSRHYLVIMLLLFSAAIMTPGASLAEEPKAAASKVNMGGGSGNGGGSGTVTPDLFTGTMSYSIPIEVPEGRKGMSPGLSLDYKSNNGNGWVGVGWELEVGAIERSMKGGVKYDGDDYILRISGATMDLANVGGIDYRAKIEGEFYRIRKQSGTYGAYWEVTDKSGTRYLYGQKEDTRQFDPSLGIFKWCLDRVEDTNGNAMTFSYSKDQGQIYLDRIDYTLRTSGISSNNYVKFYLESRTDAPDKYSTRFRIQTAKRLKTIEVRANGTHLVRAYKLDYAYSASTLRSVLMSVQQYGQDANVDQATGTISGGSMMPATTFSWSDPNAASGTFSSNFNWTSPPDKGTGFAVQIGDFDGDGFADIHLFKSATGEHYVWLNQRDGTFPDNFNWYSGPGHGNGYTVLLGDFDGDGKTDIHMFNSSSGDHIVWLNGGSGTFNTNQYSWQSGPGHGNGWYGNPYIVQLGNLNKDGKTDIYMFHPYAFNNIVWLNEGHGTFNNNMYTWQSGICDLCGALGYQGQLGDFNGDGVDDIYHNTLTKSLANWFLWQDVTLNNGTGTFPYVLLYDGTATVPSNYSWSSRQGHFNTWVNSYSTQLVDFNGDGNADIYIFDPSTGDHIVWLNNGDGQFAVAGDNETFPVNYTWRSGTGHGSGYLVHFGDFNGDGSIDISMFNSSAGDHIVWLNKGDGTFPASYSWQMATNRATGYTVQIGDFNGDGKTDIHMFNASTGEHAIWLNQGTYPDLLAKISNGIGGSTSIEYKPSTQYTNTFLPFPVNVVSSITTSDGNNIVSTVTYTYSRGYYHIEAKDFRGFNYVKVTGPGSVGEQIITETWFHQGADTAVDVNNPNVDNGYMKGKPYRTRVKDASNKVYSEATTVYSTFTGTGWQFNPPKQVDSYLCNGNITIQDGDTTTTCGDGNSGRHTKTAYTYDAADAMYGNVSRIDNYGDVNYPNDDSTIVKSYAYNAAKWIVGLPLTESVFKGIGTTTQKSKTTILYDGTSDCTFATANDSQTPSMGNVTRIVRWLDGVNDPDVRMAYDDYGNLRCTRDANGNVAKINYDTSFTFPVKTITPLVAAYGNSLTTTTEYYGVDGIAADKGLYGQVWRVTDPNGAMTIKEYDAFGRLTKILWDKFNLWHRFDAIPEFWDRRPAKSGYVRLSSLRCNRGNV
jgi:hypothetical protein